MGVLEREAPRGEQRERLGVRGGIDAQRAEHAQLLVDDLIGIEGGSNGPASARSRDDDRPAGPGELDGLPERGGCLRGDVDHDIGETARGVPQGADRIDRVDIDGEIGTELGRDGQPGGVTRRGR